MSPSPPFVAGQATEMDKLLQEALPQCVSSGPAYPLLIAKAALDVDADPMTLRC